MRVAVVNLVPTPYREPLYRSLSRTAGLSLRVFYIQSRDSLRGWTGFTSSYESIKLTCLTPEFLYPVPLVGVLNRGLTPHLRRFSPHCLLIYGYSYLSQMQAMRWAIRNRVPYLLWADSNSHRLGARGALGSFKQACLRYFCRHAAGVLSIGSLNEKFWSHYGVEPGRQFRSPLAVDNEYFATESEKWRREKAAQRRALGLPDGPLLLYAGRFAPEKNLALLLRALTDCGRQGGPALSLVLVGDGPEKPRLNRLIRELGLSNVFQFGFQPQSELPRFYGLADALVLPSLDEPWGLVVNEAMASQLPVLISRSTGCLPDLLEEGGNGFSFDEKDAGSVAACLLRFARLGEDERLRMGLQSARRIAEWSYPQALAGIHRALEAAVAAPSLSVPSAS
ncbi:MAG: glycosyltransferase [Acidobacteria bacterium]|nr:glycosyltransferase [Acidobacteriota bacterium]